MTNNKFEPFEIVKILEGEHRGSVGYIRKNYPNRDPNCVTVVICTPEVPVLFSKDLHIKYIEHHQNDEFFNNIPKYIKETFKSKEEKVKNGKINQNQFEQEIYNFEQDLKLYEKLYFEIKK